MWLLMREYSIPYVEEARIPVLLFEDVAEAMIWAENEEEPESNLHYWHWSDEEGEFCCALPDTPHQYNSWIIAWLDVYTPDE